MSKISGEKNTTAKTRGGGSRSPPGPPLIYPLRGFRYGLVGEFGFADQQSLVVGEIDFADHQRLRRANSNSPTGPHPNVEIPSRTSNDQAERRMTKPNVDVVELHGIGIVVVSLFGGT